MNTRVSLFRAALLLLATPVLLAFAGLQPAWSGPPLSGSMSGFVVESMPVAEPLTPFTDDGGHPLDLSRFRSKLVLVNFWATWCGPCVTELPSLARLKQMRGSSRFAVVNISIDAQGAASVDPFLTKHNLASLDHYLDPGSALFQALHFEGVPSTLLIDPQGRILGHLEGDAVWDSPEALALIDYYLKPKPLPQVEVSERD